MGKARNADLVLASGSPRRHRLLLEAGIPHVVLSVDVDECLAPGVGPKEGAISLAERKALRGGALRPRSRILAADTLVAVGSLILGKPKDADQAKDMLRTLSGRRHDVVTGVVLIDPDTGLMDRRAVVTGVTFRDLSDSEIEAYVGSGEPLDKAGAYGIQGAAGDFVLSIAGPFDNVVGLPVKTVIEMLGGSRPGGCA